LFTCKEVEQKDLTAESHEQLLTVYKHTIEDIERTKQWQWKFTYYTVIAQVAILALYSQYHSMMEEVCLKIFFVTIAISLAILGIFLIHRSQCHLEKFRGRMEGCRKYFTNSVKELFEESEKIEKSEKIPVHKYLILGILVNSFIVVLILSVAK